MNKRIVAVIGAVVLALVGVVMLAAYAKDADDRAFNGAELTSVLRVTDSIPADTTATDAAGSVELVKLPRKAVADGAIADLADVSGLKTTVQLEPGEQVLASRWAKEGSGPAADERGASTGVPKGYQEVTVQLALAQAGGGLLKPGDIVGVVASYPTTDTGGFTQLAKNFVRVTRVINGDTKGGDEAAVSQQLVTLAVTTRDAGRIINAAEFGKVWLTQQNKDTATGHGGSVTKSEVTK